MYVFVFKLHFGRSAGEIKLPDYLPIAKFSINLPNPLGLILPITPFQTRTLFNSVYLINLSRCNLHIFREPIHNTRITYVPHKSGKLKKKFLTGDKRITSSKSID